jgi:hypothetical protein
MASRDPARRAGAVRPVALAVRCAAAVITVVVALVAAVLGAGGSAAAGPRLTGCEGELTSVDADGETLDRAAGSTPHDVVNPDNDDDPTFTRGSPFRVDPGGRVEWAGRSAGTITDQKWSLSIWGVDVMSGSGRNVERLDTADGTVEVDDAVPLGMVGSFRVDGTLDGDGGRCDASGWVEVGGSPLFKPVWFAAIALVAAGALLLLVAQPKQVAREGA